MNQPNLPEGYRLTFGDVLTLIAPDGSLLGRFTTYGDPAKEAWRHQARNNCLLGPGCRVCEDRKRRERRGLVA